LVLYYGAIININITNKQWWDIVRSQSNVKGIDAVKIKNRMRKIKLN